MNVTFLNGAFLFAALAALLPLLIHLISRRRVATIDFSSLRFLKELERKRIRRVRLRQILLLVVRSLILLSVALALARPTLRGAVGGLGGHARTSVAIVVDNSASMGRAVGDGTLMDGAVRAGAEIVSLLDEGDQAFLVSAARPARSLLDAGTFSRDVVLDALAEMRTSAASTDYTRAVEVASALLGGARNLNREMYLIGDMQASGWTGSGRAADGGASAVYVIAERGPEANLSVESVTVERRYGGGTGVHSVAARIANHGRRGGETLVRLYMDGERAGQAGVEVDRDGAATARFAVPVDEKRWHAGMVELPDDAFAPDNRRYFVIPPVTRTEVLVVRPGGSADRSAGALDDADYVERALDPTGRGERFSVSTVRAGSLSNQDRDRFPVVVLADVGRLDPAGVRWLRDHVANGGGVLLVLGNRTDIRFWNADLLPDLAGVRVRAPLERAGGVRLSPAAREHPMLDGLVSGGRLIDDISVRRAFEIESGAAEEVLELPGIGPALVVSRAPSGGEVATLATGLDPSWNDVPRSGLIVPLLHRLVERLERSGRGGGSALVGSDLEVGLPGPVGATVVAAAPDGRELIAEPRPGRRPGAVVRAVGVPGVYRFESGGRLLAMGAVNVAPSESDLRPLDENALAERLSPLEPVFLAPGPGLAGQVLETRYGRELWRVFLYLALALLALEMLIARPRSA